MTKRAFTRGIAAIGLAILSTAAGSADLRIVDAARRGDTAAIGALLRAGVDPSARQKDGTTALHWAAYRDDLAAAEQLIRAGADVRAANDLGATPLWAAALNANVAMVGRLLEAGADANAALTLGETALMTAARTGNAEIVAQLLAKGADPNRAAARGQTALMWAAAQRHPAVVRALLAGGADVHLRSQVWSERRKTDLEQSSHPDYQVTIAQGGDTALMFAARSGDLASVQLLVEAGANVDDQSAYGTSAATLAAHADHADVVAFLLERGANPDAAAAGYTALHAAILRRNLSAVTALLAHGADPNRPLRAATPARRDSEDYHFHNTFVGATPLWLAARFGQPEIMRQLARHGADPTFVLDVTYGTGSYGTYAYVHEGPTTVLMAAVGMGGDISRGWQAAPAAERAAQTLEAVQAAVELGIDVDAVNADGNTALHGATARQLDGVAQYLVQRGADVTVLNKNGQTPLDSDVAPGRGRRRSRQ